MTTTLRPTTPERHTADGGRARSYQVCVNSRPVGRIELTTDERFGPTAGRIDHLEIDEPDRRRGRATVAALAAEEVLRGWGCQWIEASVPAAATGTLRLAEMLGYRERSRNLRKELDAPPPLPDGSRLRAMSAAEYPAWLAREREEYIGNWAARGVPEERARVKADRDYALLLPQGAVTPGIRLRILAHAGVDVGVVWAALLDPPQAEADAYVYVVSVREEHRGRGHGRTLMLAAERECLAAGAHRLGLHVFAGNTPALRLYESLGYHPTQHHLVKELL